MANKAVVIRTRDGSEYGMASAEKAKAVYPDAEIISYANGMPYEPTVSVTDSKSVSKMSRDELEAHASTLGIENPGEYANVGALREAIKNA